MTPAVKWIGGATAAIVLAIGTATIATGFLNEAEADTAPRLDHAIPVDETVLASQDASSTAAESAAIEPEPASATQDETFVIKRILPIEGPMKYGDWHWDDEGVPDGPLVITVDLEARVMSVFQDGHEIGAAVAMLGTDKHPTPLGTFPILTKERHNVSEKYGNAPMPWTLRLTWDGIAIHGGSEVENGYASHGCIAVPDEIASRLFDKARKGDKVIITRGETLQMGDAII